MRLTKKQQEELLEQFKERKKTSQPCTFCGNTTWTISDKVYEIREFQHGDLVIGGTSSMLPLIAITCSRCGKTDFLNAILLGVVSPTNGKAQEDGLEAKAEVQKEASGGDEEAKGGGDE